jgi:hypothetical protein
MSGVAAFDSVREPTSVPFSLQYDATNAHQDHSYRIQPARSQHDQHRRDHWRRHCWLAQEPNRRTLMQRVPPLNREIDYGDVDDANKRQYCARAIGPPMFVNS